MSFAAALASLDTAARSMFGITVTINGCDVTAVLAPIELLQPWATGGLQDLPTCELHIARVDWLRVFNPTDGKLGKVKIELAGGRQLRAHQLIDDPLSTDVRVQCGPIDK